MKRCFVLILFYCVLSIVLPAQTSSFFEGRGGEGIRIAVLRPSGDNLSPGEEWLARLVQSTLTADFNKYSAMTVLDRQNLDKILAEQAESLSGNYSESDYIRIGNLTNARYILTGSLTKTSGGFMLELSVTDTETGVRAASFPPRNCSLDEVQSTAVIKEAAEDLLTQLGVTLTAAGRQALRESISAIPRAADTSAAITTEKGERVPFAEYARYLEENADALYTQGAIREAFEYYKRLSEYFPGYCKGWLGIVRCYSGNFTNFDFIDSEVYMERTSITANGNAETKEVAKIRAAFDAQWPDIVIKREERAREEARRREENFNRMAFKLEGGTLVEYRGSDTEEVVIPPEITVIGHAAFRRNTRLQRVILHNNITVIEREAFRNCTSLTEIVIPASVTSIGTGVFSGCDSLAAITIPGSIKVIPDNAFYDCNNLRGVIIRAGVERIDKAFQNCASLAAIVIPQSVNAIGGFAFSGCKNLTTVTLLNNNVTIGRRAFLNCPLANKEEMIRRFGAEVFN